MTQIDANPFLPHTQLGEGEALQRDLPTPLHRETPLVFAMPLSADQTITLSIPRQLTPTETIKLESFLTDIVSQGDLSFCLNQ